MFNDQQNDQAQVNTDIDTVAQEISGQTQPLGLGSNPAAFSSPQMTPPSAPPASPEPPAEPYNPPTPQVNDTPSAPAPAVHATITENNDLESIKHDALEQLSPLVDKLDQPPEEKYKTIMMLIQASDNPDLIKGAYEAANAIADESEKAKALLAVVNEINYLTQQKSN